MLPSLPVRSDGIDSPIFEDEMGRVQVRNDGEPGWSHFSEFDEPAATFDVLLAPQPALASRCEALDGLAFINALLGAVNPSETQCHLHGIHVPDDSRMFGIRTVHTKPEIVCR